MSKSPFPLSGCLNGNTCIIWEKSHSLSKAQVGSYLYLFGTVPETHLEAIFSLKNGKLCLHYSFYSPPVTSETIITRYLLNDRENIIFQTILDRAEEIHEPEVKNLLEHEVLGAEYW